MYYLIKNDGTSVFLEPKPLDFCLHCLVQTLDSEDPALQDLQIRSISANQFFFAASFHSLLQQ